MGHVLNILNVLTSLVILIKIVKMLHLTALLMEQIASQLHPAQKRYHNLVVLLAQMEIVGGCLHLVLIVEHVHYSLIVLQQKEQQPSNVKLGVNNVSQMEYPVY